MFNQATAVAPDTGWPLDNQVGAGGRRHHNPAKAVITMYWPQPRHAVRLSTAAVYPADTQPDGTLPRSRTTDTANFLADSSQTLFGHQPTLCAACPT